MKKIFIILALILLSCSKESVNDTYNDNTECGIISLKHENVPNCEENYGFTWIIDGNIARFECCDEVTYNRIDIGDRFCLTSYND